MCRILINLDIIFFSECKYPLGMSSGYITKNQIISSSDDTVLHNFDSARISLIFQSGTGWIPALNDSQPWLEITLGSVCRITSIVTQGCGNEDFWVTSYSVSYLQRSNDWIEYVSGSQVQVCHYF